MDDRIEQATLMLLSAYGLVMKALAALPLAIELPEPLSDPDRAEIRTSLARATRLLDEIPMGVNEQTQIRMLLIDCLLCEQVLTSAEADYDEWKIEAVVVLSSRIRTRWRLIHAALGATE